MLLGALPLAPYLANNFTTTIIPHFPRILRIRVRISDPISQSLRRRVLDRRAMRLLSSSPKPPLNVSIHPPRSSDNVIRLHPTRSRCFALIAWIISLYSVATVICINIGGVGWPLASQENPISRLGNPGFELLQVREQSRLVQFP